jgi:hypothetical protein
VGRGFLRKRGVERGIESGGGGGCGGPSFLTLRDLFLFLSTETNATYKKGSKLRLNRLEWYRS